MFAIYSKDDLAVKQMKSKDVANSFVTKLPSFRKFVETHSGNEKLDLLVDDAHIKVDYLDQPLNFKISFKICLNRTQ